MLSLLMLAPVQRALVALLFAGASFPLAGVMVIRLNMLLLRYTLMHALLLAGAVSLALELPQLPLYIIVSVFTVMLMLRLSRRGGMDLGLSSAFLMVLAVALAALITQVADVPSKDTLELLWGSPFTIHGVELAAFIALSILIIAYTVAFRKRIMLLFFDRDVAYTSSRHMVLHEDAMVFLTAFAVTLSMRFIGALLIDALLLLPAVCALKRARSVKGLLVSSSLIGLIVSLTGFLLSLAFDLPPSGMTALASAVAYILIPRRKED